MRKKSTTVSLSLFTETASSRKEDAPLALRLSPKTLDDVAGQEHLLGPGKLLRRALEADRLTSAIFFGPPGSGKSAVVRLIAHQTQSAVEELNAVTAGVADVRAVIDRAKDRKSLTQQRTLLILDEIHRFNRAQQDALLPDVERGLITLIGLTTENPFFYVNSALLSRAQVFEFKLLSNSALNKVLDRALRDSDQGLGNRPMDLDADAREHLILQANGDARRLLNALELAALTTPSGAEGRQHITLAVAEDCVQKRALVHDKSGDQHYDIASAFIKSLRGGDPDAALYWMARLLKAGDDPRFIARRLIISASEDIGNADPRALLVAHAALAAVEFVGMPEGRIPLAQAAVYLACAPKSNSSYYALEKAMSEVENGPAREVPNHLKDANLDRQALGHGQGYLYPHNFPEHFVPQEYWPHPVPLYTPGELGYETEMRKRLDAWKNKTKANSAKDSSKKETA
jgi:putative ATPase